MYQPKFNIDQIIAELKALEIERFAWVRERANGKKNQTLIEDVHANAFRSVFQKLNEIKERELKNRLVK